MYSLRFSIVASFAGEHPDLAGYWPCDTTLSDVIRDWPGETPEPSDPFDTDYDYVAREGSIPGPALERLSEVDSPIKFQICRRLKELYPRDAFWACLSEVQVSGVFDRKTALKFLSDIGAHFETENTLGTLGGPLGGIVPDIAFNIEGSALISSIRITPVLCRDGEPVRAPSESQWARIVEILRREDLWKLARH